MNELILASQVAPSPDVPLIVARGVSNVGRDSAAPPLEELNLEVWTSTFLVLLGPAKTPVIRMLAAIERPTHGKLYVAGMPLGELAECEAIAYRRAAVTMVSASSNLLPRLTLQQNLELPLLLTDCSADERRERARSALELVGLGSVMRRRAEEISRATAQRACIARSLLTGANLVLLDEPCDGLVENERAMVLDLLVQLNRLFRKTIVLGTTDRTLAKHASHVQELTSASSSAIWHRGAQGTLSMTSRASEALSA